jgi:hypothetical protein
MKKVLLSMAAVGALAAAAPAAAQYGSSVNAGGQMGFSSRISQIEARLQAGISAGVIDRAEARDLRMQIRQLRRLEAQYSYNGLTQAERQDLRQRLREVRADLRLADNGRFDRDNRYAWDDRYDNDDVYSQRIDRNRDGWDDRDYDRDGRIDDDLGRGGPYEEPYDAYCETNTRGGIGGLIDGVLGRSDNACAVRVGSRAPSNLYSVPSHLRYQFRDGNGVYYRSDGRNVYQIDARTQTVLRIYPMDR